MDTAPGNKWIKNPISALLRNKVKKTKKTIKRSEFSTPAKKQKVASLPLKNINKKPLKKSVHVVVRRKKESTKQSRAKESSLKIVMKSKKTTRDMIRDIPKTKASESYCSIKEEDNLPNKSVLRYSDIILAPLGYGYCIIHPENLDILGLAAYVNDQIVQFYGTRIIKKCSNPDDFAMFDSLFLSLFDSHNHLNERVIAKLGVINQKTWFVPINVVSEHWKLMVIVNALDKNKETHVFF